ncbi:hypothetical protein BTO05_02630 [Winogradskyella sp. PC-19]|uniref:hypothetical protein n=1 Tax=unclassified Winogradskyella TaxID=2615021 RepID=UPI000B3CC797|nr:MULTISPECIES: hypothetical protein [unclassified Winogradskyella]ARV08588.1 hypothetical protein BTO05_02630 [Winogradskyella sp. PC-19]
MLIAEVEEEEYGLIDYQDFFDESIEESNQSLHRMSDAMGWVSEQFEKKTAEMTALAQQPNIGRKAVRVLFIKTAKVMDNFGSRIETETPIFFDNFGHAIDALQKTLDIYRNDFNVDIEEVKDTRESLSGLIDTMEASLPNTEEFINSIDAFPRMSKEINKSRFKLSTKLNKLLDNFKISISIATELHKSFDDFLDQRE